jgi:hypothetical protein
MSNLPPGCRVSDIPGNGPEDGAAEAAADWAIEQLTEAKLNPGEFRRAVLVGIAAVLAEREIFNYELAEARGIEREALAMERAANPFGGPSPVPQGEQATAGDLRTGDEFSYLVLSTAGDYWVHGAMSSPGKFINRDDSVYIAGNTSPRELEIKNPKCPVIITRRAGAGAGGLKPRRNL